MASSDRLQFLEWDSVFFGVQVGRAVDSRLTSEAMAELTASCQEERIDCLYLLVDPNETTTIRLAEENDFHLVDIRVTLDCHLPVDQPPWQSSTAGIRLATAADSSALRPVAAANHRDSRFYQDGGFAADRCDELYATWIEKSCNGYADAVLVADYGAGAVGYVSCHLRDDGHGQIGLVGVSSACQGKGLGRQLLNESLRWFSAAGVSRLEVVTQGRNLAAQRLYQKSGFLTNRLELWYHRWFQFKEELGKGGTGR